MKMDNNRIIYSTRENIKSTLAIFLKYKKSVLWINFFVVLLTLLTQFAVTYLPGWIVDLLTGENAGLQVWTRVLPVVVLIGISELVIEVLNQKKADGSEKLKTGDCVPDCQPENCPGYQPRSGRGGISADRGKGVSGSGV